jgi:amino acid transporter
VSTKVIPPAGPLYSRRATGLVRSLSVFDAFVLCFSAVAVPIGITQAFLFAPQLFPGVNMTWSFAIAAIVALFLGLVYLYYTQVMPQSGGDYVWVSRVLHPAIGFTVGAVSAFTPLQFAAINLAIQTTIFLPAFAYLTGDTDLVVGQTAQMLIVVVGTLIITGLMLLGVRWVARLSGILFGLVMIGMVVWLVLLLFGSPADFRKDIDAGGGMSYQEVISTAQADGFDTSASLKSTLLGVVFGFQFFIGFQWMAYFAGEVRQAARTARYAILGTWALTAGAFILASVLVYHYYGYDFLSAAGYLFNNQPDSYNLDTPPYISSLVPYLTSSEPLQYLIIVSFLAAIAWSSMTFFLVASRLIFAWSFDRVVPEALSRVNDRSHAPVWSIVVTGALLLILGYLTVYTEFWGYLVNWVAVIAAAVVVVAASLTLLPVLRPEMWSRAPDSVKERWAGILKVQVVGAVMTVMAIAIVIVVLTTPAIGGGVTVKSLVYAFAIPVVAFVYYWISRAVRRRQGVRLDRAFDEIPSD